MDFGYTEWPKGDRGLCAVRWKSGHVRPFLTDHQGDLGDCKRWNLIEHSGKECECALRLEWKFVLVNLLLPMG